MVTVIIASLVLGAAALVPSPSELAAEIQQAAITRRPVFQVPTGEYNFGSQSLLLSGASSFEVDGQGATLWFSCGFGVQIHDSASVHVHNLTIDYDPPCFAQGVITSVEPGRTLIHAIFDAHFMRPEIGFLANYTPKIAYWDPQTKLMLRNHSVPFSAINNFLANSTRVSAHSWSYVLELKAPIDISRTPSVGAGSLITVHARMDNGVYNGPAQAYLVWNSSAIVSEDVSIFGSGAMGFVEGLGEGGNTYRRVRVSRRNRRGSDTLRLLSTNVDGMHSGQLHHGPLFEDSEVAYTGDDLGNIHTRMEIVLKRLSDHALLLLDTEEGHTLGAAGFVGAKLTFRRLSTFAFAGSAHVAAVLDIGLPDGWKDPAAYADNLTATLNKAPYHAAVRLNTILPRAYVVNFTESLPAQVEGMWSLFQSDSRENSGAIVRNNHWHDGYARVLLCRSSNSVISDNRFERAGGLLVEAASTGKLHWLEGPLSMSNATIANNTLSGCGGAEWLRDRTGTSGFVVSNNTVMDRHESARATLSEMLI